MKRKFYCSVVVLTISVTGMQVTATESAVAGEFLINTYTPEPQRYPSVASDGVQYLVGWNSLGQDGSESGVYGQLIRKDGSKFGAEFRINTNTNMTQDTINISSNGSNFLAVWDSQELSSTHGYTDRVRGQLLNSNGAKIGSEIRISENATARDNWNYGVTSNGTDYLTTWRIHDYSSQYARRIGGSGSPIGSEFSMGIPGHSARSTSNGTNYFLTWSEWCSTGWEIKGRLMNPDGTFSGPQLDINTYNAGQEEHSRIASDGSNFLITWQGTQEGSYGIYGQVVSGIDGSAIGPELHLNPYTPDTQYPTGLASNGEDYLVTWASKGQDGDGYGVYARLIDGDGSFIGSEFRVNSYKSGDQQSASVASDGSGYLITWSGEGSEDSSGIYGNFLNAEDHTIFGYLTEAGANLSLSEAWELGDLNQLYGLHEAAGAPLLIDGETWYFLEADFSGSGIWGGAHPIGDAWENNDSKYIFLSAGSGLTTNANPVPIPGSLLLLTPALAGLGIIRKTKRQPNRIQAGQFQLPK